jgi:hypothetical protein
MSEALLSLIPFAVITLVFFVFSIPLSRRKGKSFIYPILCLIPIRHDFHSSLSRQPDGQAGSGSAERA